MSSHSSGTGSCAPEPAFYATRSSACSGTMRGLRGARALELFTLSGATRQLRSEIHLPASGEIRPGATRTVVAWMEESQHSRSRAWALVMNFVTSRAQAAEASAASSSGCAAERCRRRGSRRHRHDFTNPGRHPGYARSGRGPRRLGPKVRRTARPANRAPLVDRSSGQRSQRGSAPPSDLCGSSRRPGWCAARLPGHARGVPAGRCRGATDPAPQLTMNFAQRDPGDGRSDAAVTSTRPTSGSARWARDARPGLRAQVEEPAAEWRRTLARIFDRSSLPRIARAGSAVSRLRHRTDSSAHRRRSAAGAQQVHDLPSPVDRRPPAENEAPIARATGRCWSSRRGSAARGVPSLKRLATAGGVSRRRGGARRVRAARRLRRRHRRRDHPG